MKEPLLHGEVTDAIIKAYYHVYNTLGPGFLERVYERALAISLQQRGYTVEKHHPIKVYFEGVLVGDYFADLLVNRCVIIENKAVEAVTPHHEAQLTNYLKATPIEVGLLLNFGSEQPQFRRKILTNDRKPHLKIRHDPSDP